MPTAALISRDKDQGAMPSQNLAGGPCTPQRPVNSIWDCSYSCIIVPSICELCLCSGLFMHGSDWPCSVGVTSSEQCKGQDRTYSVTRFLPIDA